MIPVAADMPLVYSALVFVPIGVGGLLEIKMALPLRVLFSRS
jgi:hypothetical protein